MELTHEQLQKAMGAGSAEALLDLAWAEGVALTAAEAEAYFTKLHPPAGELADEELEAVSGGGCGGGGSAAPDRLMDGMTVSLGNETRCQGCGHQATFRVWNVGSAGGGGYFVGTIECPSCHTIHENKNGTFEKAQDQTRPGGFGPVMA